MEKRIITVRDLIEELEKVKDKNVTFCVSVNEVEHTPDLFDFTLLDFSDNYDNDRVILYLYR